MLHPGNIKPARGAKKAPKQIGRGNASGHGTSATRGGKGQTARSGGQRGLAIKAFKFMMQSTPKLRGFNSLKAKPSEVYLSDLEKHFASGSEVTLAALKEKNLVNSTVRTAKVIGTGELTKKLSLVGLKTTKQVAEKIKALGGEIK